MSMATGHMEVPMDDAPAKDPARGFRTAFVLAVCGFTLSLAGDEMLRFLLLTSASEGYLPVHSSVLAFAMALPGLASSWVGALVDRSVAWRRSFVVASLVSSAGLCWLLVLSWGTSWVSISAVIVGFSLEGLGMYVATSWQASVPEFAAGNERSQDKIVGWNAAGISIGPAIGPLMGAWLYVVLGPEPVVWLVAASSLVAAVTFLPAYKILRVLRTPYKKERIDIGWRSTFSGVGAVIRNDAIRAPAGSLFAMNLVQGFVTFGIPLIMIAKGYPAAWIGVTMTTMTLGSVAASFGGTVFGGVEKYRLYLILEPILRAIGLLVFAFGVNGSVMALGAFLFTVPQGVGRVARASLLARAFSPGERGRGVGGYRLIARGLVPFAPVGLIFVTDAVSAQIALVVGAALMMVVAAVVATDRGFQSATRRMARPANNDDSTSR